MYAKREVIRVSGFVIKAQRCLKLLELEGGLKGRVALCRFSGLRITSLDPIELASSTEGHSYKKNSS